jgi:hypothetical protein
MQQHVAIVDDALCGQAGFKAARHYV